MRRIYLLLALQPTLHSVIEVLNDAMGQKGLAPSLCVFGIILSLFVVNELLPTEKARMQAMALARAEKATVTTEFRI